MKWQTPKSGDKRIKRRFAWRPVQIKEDMKIWLEFYYTHDEFRANYEKKHWKILERFTKEEFPMCKELYLEHLDKKK